jgi:hypothetical protein
MADVPLKCARWVVAWRPTETGRECEFAETGGCRSAVRCCQRQQCGPLRPAVWLRRRLRASLISELTLPTHKGPSTGPNPTAAHKGKRSSTPFCRLACTRHSDFRASRPVSFPVRLREPPCNLDSRRRVPNGLVAIRTVGRRRSAFHVGSWAQERTSRFPSGIQFDPWRSCARFRTPRSVK